jgi:hypothetical protein
MPGHSQKACLQGTSLSGRDQNIFLGAGQKGGVDVALEVRRMMRTAYDWDRHCTMDEGSKVRKARI